MKIRHLAWLLPCVISASGCHANLPRLASTDIGDAFIVGADANGQITIKRDALGHAFLLTPSQIVGSNTPRLEHLPAKVVTFETQGDTIALFERNLYAVYSEVASDKLMQTFPITRQDEHTLTFSFAMGLRAITTPRLAASDFPETIADAIAHEETSLEVQNTFLRAVRIVKGEAGHDHALEIEQVSRIRRGSVGRSHDQDQDHLTKDYTVTLFIRLQPYGQNPHFEPRPSPRQRGVGYFEVARVHADSGVVDTLATRWDTRPEAGPITYLISKHTPPTMVDAVRDGILYWNRVLGRDLLRVETDADSAVAPAPRHVMVHWVSWQSATMALADFQADPITGELLSGNIYFPSAFLQAGPRPSNDEPSARIAPAGFTAAPICATPKPQLSAALQARLAGDGAAADKVRADFVRAIIAHEVGHTLGLRHNFAASGQSVLPSVEAHERTLHDYFTHANHAGAATASSVMDYLSPEDTALLGAAIRTEALPYDQAAVQWGYAAQPAPEIKTPPYCGDRDALGTLLGCAVHDSGPQPIAGYAAALAQRSQLADDAIAALVSHAGESSGRDASVAAMDRALEASFSWHNMRIAHAVFTHLQSGSGVLEVQQRFAASPWFDAERVRQETAHALGDAAEQAGGLPGLITAAYPFDRDMAPQTGWLRHALIKSLHRDHGDSSPSQARAIESHLPAFGAALEQAYLRGLLTAFTGGYAPTRSPGWTMVPSAHFAEGVVRSDWQPVLGRMARHILLDTVPAAGRVPQPRWSVDVRVAAVRLFSDRIFQHEGWLQDSQAMLLTDLQDRMATVLSENASEHHVTAELKHWLQDEQEVVTALQMVDVSY